MRMGRMTELVSIRADLMERCDAVVSEIDWVPTPDSVSNTDTCYFTIEAIDDKERERLVKIPHCKVVDAREGDLKPTEKSTAVAKKEEPKAETPDLGSMTKDELEEYGRTLGIELDKRKKKEDLIAEVVAAQKG
jgi:hypothetical protein